MSSMGFIHSVSITPLGGDRQKHVRNCLIISSQIWLKFTISSASYNSNYELLVPND